MQPTIQPIALTERATILDILRGIALFGICIANYPILSMYVFQRQDIKEAMSTAAVDQWIPYVHFALIDGKFYSLFSLLFGIGFSIILLRNQAKGKSGLGYFYRRLIILALIGLAHAFLLWNGDILFLYALIGMLLPLFRNLKDKTLIITWAVLIFSPLVFDLFKGLTDNKYNPANFFFNNAIALGNKYGITQDNFGTWQAMKTEYSDVLKFNHSGFFWRWEGLINSNRLPKVLGMFLLGLYVGRKMIYAKLEEHVPLLKKVQKWGFLIGLPFSIGHAYVELNHLPDGPIGLLHPLFYALNVVPLSLAYTATICLWYLQPRSRKRLSVFAAPGRMALTNYILQSFIAMVLFFGIGLGFGGKTPLTYVIVIAALVYLFQILFSHFWLRYFNYGPVEWIWRQLTYGKRLKLRRVKEISS
ncbi:MAG: DUF418 domain-containing protein [Ferruginibacter sp.]